MAFGFLSFAYTGMLHFTYSCVLHVRIHDETNSTIPTDWTET